MNKNVSGQKLTVFAFDSTTNLPKTGDAANITAYVSIDDAAVAQLTDTSATELSSSNAAGYYLFDVSQAETNGNKLAFSAKSSTSNIVVIAVPAVVYTRPANASSFSIDSSGRVDVIKINSVSASSVTTINANIGTTQPTNYTGTGASALVKSDVLKVGSDTNAATGLYLAGLDYNTSSYFGANVLSIGNDTISVGGIVNLGTDYANNSYIGAHVVHWNGTTVTTGVPLAPTTAGRTLDVSATGEAGIDWANIGGATTTVNLSGTTIKNTTDVATTLTTISGYIDTEVAAIKAKTDQLTFTTPNVVDATATGVDVDEQAIADAVVDALGGQEVTVSTPVNTADDNRLTIYQGFDMTSGSYLPSWTVTGYNGPSLSGGACKLRLVKGWTYNGKASFTTPDLEVSATISQASTTLTITASLTAAQTGTLDSYPPRDRDTYKYLLAGITSGNVEVPIVYGWATVVRDIPPSA